MCIVILPFTTILEITLDFSSTSHHFTRVKVYMHDVLCRLCRYVSYNVCTKSSHKLENEISQNQTNRPKTPTAHTTHAIHKNKIPTYLTSLLGFKHNDMTYLFLWRDTNAHTKAMQLLLLYILLCIHTLHTYTSITFV